MSALLKKAIYAILIFFIGLFVGSSFVIRAKYNYYIYGDIPVLAKQNPGILILIAAVLIMSGMVLYRMCLKLDKYSRRAVIPVTLIISSAIQIAVIFAFPRLPTDDSQRLITLASDMLYKNDYSSLQPRGYLYMLPHNLPTVLYFKALMFLFRDNYLVMKIFNILFSLVTTLMIYMIYKEINYKSKENDYGVLVFAAAYIPALLMCNYIYNDVIATALLTSAIYFFIRFTKERIMGHIIISSILLSIGNYFRSIGFIFLAAAVIYILLSVKEIGIGKTVLSIFLLALLITVPGLVQNTVLQSARIVNEPVGKNSMPVIMWLNMGINMENIGFWDNGESYDIYKKQGNYDKEKSKELFKKEIRDKLSRATAGDLIKMYYKKIIWVWTEGTYQIERYGIGNERLSNPDGKKGTILGGYGYTTFATDFFKGDSKYRSGLNWVLYTLNFLMYCCILVRLVSATKAQRYDEGILVLVILGFIGFYILWEIKSRYLYPVYPLLIVLSYMGFKDAHNFVVNRKAIDA